MSDGAHRLPYSETGTSGKGRRPTRRPATARATRRALLARVRLAIGNLRTERRHVARAWEILRHAAAHGAAAESKAGPERRRGGPLHNR